MTTERNKLIEKMYEDYRLILYKYALLILGNKSDAEDAVHQTFEIVCKKEEIPENPAAHSPWLRGILKNVLKHMARERNIKAKHITELTPEREKELATKESDIAADKFINYIKPDGVSDDDFEILKYKVLYGYSCEEIATRFSISTEACYKRIQRTKERLKKTLNQED